MSSLSRLRVLSAAMVTAALVGAACDGEDRSGVDVMGEVGTGAGTGNGTAAGAETATATFPAGVVEPRPQGATEVGVTLDEWSITPEVSEAEAGQIYFLAQNVGQDPHELVVANSDLAFDDLPVEDGVVVEDELDVRGEIEGFASGTSASGLFDLEPGRYILFCTIVEQEDGELESHFLQGMFSEFIVR